jgi:O-glycosyl hydrolase
LPGAKRLSLTGDFVNLIAFQNTDKSIVIIMQNDADEVKTINIKIGDKQIAPTLSSQSFNTILIK